MSEQPKDGGPAFPFSPNDHSTANYIAEGMSLRDWFAGQARPTEDQIITQMNLDRSRNPYNEPHRPRIRERHEIVAFLKFREADAMIAARSPRTGESHE